MTDHVNNLSNSITPRSPLSLCVLAYPLSHLEGSMARRLSGPPYPPSCDRTLKTNSCFNLANEYALRLLNKPTNSFPHVPLPPSRTLLDTRQTRSNASLFLQLSFLLVLDFGWDRLASQERHVRCIYKKRGGRGVSEREGEGRGGEAGRGEREISKQGHKKRHRPHARTHKKTQEHTPQWSGTS
jgi:hypothetical protein